MIIEFISKGEDVVSFFSVYKRLYKFSGIFTVFFIITFLLSIVTGNIISIKQNLDKNNEFFSENKKEITVNLPANDNIKWKDEFLNIISKQHGLILGTSLGFTDDIESNLIVKPIYFNEDIYKKFPLKKGRFLERKDFENYEDIAVIGSNYLNLMKSKNGNDYIEFNKKKYRIIGILGYNNEKSFYDNWMVINFNTYIDDNKLNKSYTVDSFNGNINDDLLKITKELKNIDKNASINILPNYMNNEDTLKFALYSSKSLTIMVSMVAVLLFINVINSAYLWVDQTKKEMSVRKAYGATNKSIMFKIASRYIRVALIASFLAIACQNIMTKSGIKLWNANMININKEANIVISLVVIAGALIIGTISAIIPMRIALKNQPSSMLRGK